MTDIFSSVAFKVKFSLYANIEIAQKGNWGWICPVRRNVHFSHPKFPYFEEQTAIMSARYLSVRRFKDIPLFMVMNSKDPSSIYICFLFLESFDFSC